MDYQLGIPLSEMIRQLRHELQATMLEGKDEDLRFRLQDIELDLEVAVTRQVGGTAGSTGKVGFWVFNADASAEASASWEKSQTQHLKLRLRPMALDEAGNLEEDVFLANEP